MDNTIGCKAPEEIDKLIESIMNDNPKYTEKLIRLAIKYCCDHQTVKKENVQFEDCAKERTKMLYFVDWREQHKNYL